MEKNIWIVLFLVGLVAGGLGGYTMGKQKGYKEGDTSGYARAQAEVKRAEELAAKKAAQEAAKTANPFQAVNPLQGVDSNPFEKAKKVLNPFQ